MPIALVNDQLTDVGTTQKYPLGTKCIVPAKVSGLTTDANMGEQEWVYIFNDEAATAFAAGDVLYRDPSAATHDLYGLLQAPATNAAARMFLPCVAQWAIAAGSYGWALVKGFGYLRAGTANITADTSVVTGGSAAGSVKDATVGTDEGIGLSLEAMATDNTVFMAFIDCVG